MKHIFFALSMLVATAQAFVVEIDGQADLDAKLKQHPQAIIKFYKPNCPHCTTIEGDYTKISAKIPNVTFLAINAATPNNKTIHPQWGVKGVPALFFVKNGIKTAYKRDRNFATSFEKAAKSHFAKYTKNIWSRH